MSAPMRFSFDVKSPIRAAAPRGFVGRVKMMMELSRQRRRLAELDAAQLADIGLTRDEALREADRSAFDNGFGVSWDAPLHWFKRVDAHS